MSQNRVYEVAEAIAWIEQDTSIGLRACSRNGDPLEFSADEAREFARVLVLLADRLDELDNA